MKPKLPSEPRALVVYKKTSYQSYVKDYRNKRIAELLERGDPAVARMLAAHEAHVASMTEVKRVLKASAAKPTYRYNVSQADVDAADIVLTVGGDGTLLWASHFVGAGKPMLAINSAPEHSVGFFTATTKDGFGEVFDQVLRGKLRAKRLSRMEVAIDDNTISTRVLNDALFCHAHPAMTTRYILDHEGKGCEHRSSGIWIGPPAGSTAAQRSAGGKVQPLEAKRLQWVVRELYVPPGEKPEMRLGSVREGESLSVVSKVRRGAVYVDGGHNEHKLTIGHRLTFRVSDEPLILLGMERR